MKKNVIKLIELIGVGLTSEQFTSFLEHIILSTSIYCICISRLGYARVE